MDKKYQVFVSSTHRIRDAVKLEILQVLLDLGCLPVGGEAFKYKGKRWPDTQQLVEESDYFILFFGGDSREQNQKHIDIARQEYQHSLKIQLPNCIIQYALGSYNLGDSAKDKMGKFDVSLPRENRNSWSTPLSLRANLRTALQNLIWENPRPGWVKANS